MFWWQAQAGDGLTVAFTNTAAGNLALHVGDDPAQVRRRRAALEQHMDVPAGSLAFMNQVHSNVVATVPRLRTPRTDSSPVSSEGEFSDRKSVV